MNTENTLSALRKECKACGIKVTKKTYTHGPHLSFEVDGIRSTNCMAAEEYEKRKDKFDKLREIKSRYKGMMLNGEKVYGLN